MLTPALVAGLAATLRARRSCRRRQHPGTGESRRTTNALDVVGGQGSNTTLPARLRVSANTSAAETSLRG